MSYLNDLSPKYTTKLVNELSSYQLNVCDYWLWSHIENRVKKRDPKNRDELIDFVNDELDNLTRPMVRKAIGNLRKRCELLVEQEGGHFQHLMK